MLPKAGTCFFNSNTVVYNCALNEYGTLSDYIITKNLPSNILSHTPWYLLHYLKWTNPNRFFCQHWPNNISKTWHWVSMNALPSLSLKCLIGCTKCLRMSTIAAIYISFFVYSYFSYFLCRRNLRLLFWFLTILTFCLLATSDVVNKHCLCRQSAMF